MLHKLTRAGVLLAVAVLSGGVASAARAAPAAAPAAAVGTLAWKRFADPAENAFTLEVPQGWTVRGGLFRLGFSDARLMVDMTSPDGSINVRLGDVSVPSYVGPSVDPLTGESRIVWTGPAQHYWANGLGDVVNSNTQPSASWHEIVPTR